MPGAGGLARTVAYGATVAPGANGEGRTRHGAGHGTACGRARVAHGIHAFASESMAADESMAPVLGGGALRRIELTRATR